MSKVSLKGWEWKQKFVFWIFFILCLVNLIVSVLALGPDILSW